MGDVFTVLRGPSALRVAWLVIDVLLCLVGAATLLGLTAWVALILPGVGDQFRSPMAAMRQAAAFAVLCGFPAVAMSMFAAASVRGGMVTVGSRVRSLPLRLGLTGGGPIRGLTLVSLGIMGGVVAYLTSSWITQTFSFTPPPGVDARFEAVGQAPAWAGGLYFAVVAAPWEEMLYRGPVILAATYLLARTWPRCWRVVAVGGIWLVSSVYFGGGHLEFSQLNAVTATANGLLYGGLALVSRSLWPAVLAHGLYNFLAGVAVVQSWS